MLPGLSEAWPGPALGSECPLGLATNPTLALATVCGFQLFAAPRPPGQCVRCLSWGSEHPSAFP